MPMERADCAEAAYQRMEAQLEVMKQANSIMPEVKTEYAHYGNSWRNDQEAVMPDRLVMLDVLKILFSLYAKPLKQSALRMIR